MKDKIVIVEYNGLKCVLENKMLMHANLCVNMNV